MKDFKDCKECGYLYPKKTKLPECYGTAGCPVTECPAVMEKDYAGRIQGTGSLPTTPAISTISVEDAERKLAAEVIKSLYNSAYKEDEWIIICGMCGDMLDNLDLDTLSYIAERDGWTVEENIVICPKCNAERT